MKNKQKITTFFNNHIIILFLTVLVFYVGITRVGFFSGSNFSNLASNIIPRFVIALGVSGYLIIKGTDLSAGRMVGLGGVIACTLLQRTDYSNRFFENLGELPLLSVVLIVVLITAFFGLLNGLIIAYLKVPPFLATLGIQTVVYGINLVYSGADPIGGLREDYTDIASYELFSIQGFSFKAIFLIGILLGLFFWFLYNKTRYGKYMYAIGGNEHAAEVSGVLVNRSKVKIFTLAGCMYGIAGFILAAKSGGASVSLGLGYELEAIAACTIGGISTSGGVGKVSGILLGVLVFELLKTSMQFLKINSSYQFIVQGAVIIIAVAIDIRKYLVKK